MARIVKMFRVCTMDHYLVDEQNKTFEERLLTFDEVTAKDYVIELIEKIIWFDPLSYSRRAMQDGKGVIFTSSKLNMKDHYFQIYYEECEVIFPN